MSYKRVKPFFGINENIADSSVPFSLIAAANTNATLVNSGPGVITAIHAINVAAGVKYLKFYDTAKLPVAGSGTPVRRYAIPTVATTGAGFVLCPAIPLRFVNGIAFTITGGQADSDATNLAAGDVTLTLEYI
jgi:hypothetical protein